MPPFRCASELEQWFATLSPDGTPRVDRLELHERSLRAVELIGGRGFFTDANACISRAVWLKVPFREVPYAEDRVLAIDMLRAGYAKAFVPQASVWHSHDHTASEHLRRCFDEWRGLREVYGWREPAAPAHLARQLRGALGQARRELIREGVSLRAPPQDAHRSERSPRCAARRRTTRLAGRPASGLREAQAVAGGPRGLCAPGPERRPQWHPPRTLSSR